MTAQSKTNSADSHKLLPSEKKAALTLALLYASRMLGLFLILPVFTLYAEHLGGATPVAIGLAIGIYGLTQALLQIPYGMVSDRLGRKPVIIVGLLVFALGSVVAAMAEHIVWVIVGRALQGCGAIAAAVLALAADLSREEQRTKVMAIIGSSIGLSFALALMLGPVLSVWIGVAGIFWLTAALAMAGILVVSYAVPQPVTSRLHRDTQAVPKLFGRVLHDPQLLRLDFGIFTLHLALTATFVALPLLLRDTVGLPGAQHWQLYLPALLLGLALMAPAVVLSEKRRQLKPFFLAAIAVLSVSVLVLAYGARGGLSALLGLVLFFAGFNFLEASLPSLVARLAPADAKGTALGAYSTCQFLGAFVGGALAGWVYGAFGVQQVFLLVFTAMVLWLAVALSMRSPPHLSSYLLKVGSVSEVEAETLATRLLQIPGVAEAVVIAHDGIAYLKVDRQALDESALRAVAVTA